MNILFIEDEDELLETAVNQLRVRGHTVYPVSDIAAAREVIQDEGKGIKMVITDHRLPDGLGIQFAIEIQKTYPNIKSAIVSGCLTPDDIKKLESNGLLYFNKPLLYGKVVERIRQHYAMKAQVTAAVDEEAAVEAESTDEVVSDPPADTEVTATKKRWRLFGSKQKDANPEKDA